uniref:(northern house mosquito) hypothetical protein n=1 Tax=Culex pipiens TaxID=7175 RepID=A0A8D8F6L7_CULPI
MNLRPVRLGRRRHRRNQIQPDAVPCKHQIRQINLDRLHLRQRRTLPLLLLFTSEFHLFSKHGVPHRIHSINRNVQHDLLLIQYGLSRWRRRRQNLHRNGYRQRVPFTVAGLQFDRFRRRRTVTFVHCDVGGVAARDERWPGSAEGVGRKQDVARGCFHTWGRFALVAIVTVVVVIRLHRDVHVVGGVLPTGHLHRFRLALPHSFHTTTTTFTNPGTVQRHRPRATAHRRPQHLRHGLRNRQRRVHITGPPTPSTTPTGQPRVVKVRRRFQTLLEHSQLECGRRMRVPRLRDLKLAVVEGLVGWRVDSGVRRPPGADVGSLDGLVPPGISWGHAGGGRGLEEDFGGGGFRRTKAALPGWSEKVDVRVVRGGLLFRGGGLGLPVVRDDVVNCDEHVLLRVEVDCLARRVVPAVGHFGRTDVHGAGIGHEFGLFLGQHRSGRDVQRRRFQRQSIRYVEHAGIHRNLRLHPAFFLLGHGHRQVPGTAVDAVPPIVLDILLVLPRLASILHRRVIDRHVKGRPLSGQLVRVAPNCGRFIAGEEFFDGLFRLESDSLRGPPRCGRFRWTRLQTATGAHRGTPLQNRRPFALGAHFVFPHKLKITLFTGSSQSIASLQLAPPIFTHFTHEIH